MMLAATLDPMARGGIYDQFGGGFHRYSVDRDWRVPHFEKMLYDNALLLEVYARDFARTGAPERARVARETAGFLLRELAAPEGGFWSALDAETDGHEGAFYAWRRGELEAALGAEDAAFAAPLLGCDGEPFFERDGYVLHLPKPVEVLARERRMTAEQLLAELAGPRARLLAVRGARPRPATDDKILTDWNGLAVAGLAVAGRALGEPAWVARAARGAEFLLAAMRPAGGPLCHVWRGGPARIDAYLGDYAGLLRGLLALAEADGAARWIAVAARARRRDDRAPAGARRRLLQRRRLPRPAGAPARGLRWGDPGGQRTGRPRARRARRAHRRGALVGGGRSHRARVRLGARTAGGGGQDPGPRGPPARRGAACRDGG